MRRYADGVLCGAEALQIDVAIVGNHGVGAFQRKLYGYALLLSIENDDDVAPFVVRYVLYAIRYHAFRCVEEREMLYYGFC